MIFCKPHRGLCHTSSCHSAHRSTLPSMPPSQGGCSGILFSSPCMVVGTLAITTQGLKAGHCLRCLGPAQVDTTNH